MWLIPLRLSHRWLFPTPALLIWIVWSMLMFLFLIRFLEKASVTLRSSPRSVELLLLGLVVHFIDEALSPGYRWLKSEFNLGLMFRLGSFASNDDFFDLNDLLRTNAWTTVLGRVVFSVSGWVIGPFGSLGLASLSQKPKLSRNFCYLFIVISLFIFISTWLWLLKTAPGFMNLRLRFQIPLLCSRVWNRRDAGLLYLEILWWLCLFLHFQSEWRLELWWWSSLSTVMSSLIWRDDGLLMISSLFFHLAIIRKIKCVLVELSLPISKCASMHFKVVFEQLTNDRLRQIEHEF